jgi:hypothetical protein
MTRITSFKINEKKFIKVKWLINVIDEIQQADELSELMGKEVYPDTHECDGYIRVDDIVAFHEQEFEDIETGERTPTVTVHLRIGTAHMLDHTIDEFLLMLQSA